MNLEPAPRLKKIPFIAVAITCIVAIGLIGLFAQDKFAPLPFLSSVGFLILSIIAFMIPVLADYAADSAEYVQQERERLNEQVQRLHVAGESLARAAAQIKAVEEAVHKTAHAAENLPYRMQEKLAEFNTALAEKEESEREALEEELVELRAANSEQLKAVAEKIQKAGTEWAALETATRKQLSVAEASLAKIQHAASDTAAQFEAKLTAALATLDGKLARLEALPAAPVVPVATAAPQKAALATPEPAPVEETAPPSVTQPLPLVESIAVLEPTPPHEPTPEPEDSKAKKPRVPRKPKPEETLAAMSEPAAVQSDEDVISGGFALADSPEEHSSAASRAEIYRSEPVESAASSDGATRLLATAYIGIGNKLFIRGDGPGLSWEKGVPMQFVSIGKWGWATNEATAPVRCALYKNDEVGALTGEVVLDPGKHVEITALF